MTITKSSGFTLIEVLVATAIMGIALGVLLSGFAQGHRQAFRGDTAREAAFIAESVLYDLFSESESLSPCDGEVEDRPGWKYEVDVRDLIIKMPEEEEQEVEVPELREFVLTVHPPDNARSFVLTGWIPAEQI